MRKMKFKTLYLLAFIQFILFVGCKQKQETSIGKPKRLELPKGFAEFLDTFQTDSIYQMNHIIFPLEGAVRAPGENPDSMIPYKWRKYKWQLHHKFNNYDSIFKRSFVIFNETTIIEKTSAINGLFKMERRFAKMDNGWNLIYYSVN